MAKGHKIGDIFKTIGKIVIVLLILLSIHFHIDWTMKLQRKEYNEVLQKMQQLITESKSNLENFETEMKSKIADFEKQIAVAQDFPKEEVGNSFQIEIPKTKSSLVKDVLVGFAMSTLLTMKSIGFGMGF